MTITQGKIMDKPSLLILDDEREVLNALNRVLRKHFQLFLFFFFQMPMKPLASIKITLIFH
jgi:PleD family two-component response regulator